MDLELEEHVITGCNSIDASAQSSSVSHHQAGPSSPIRALQLTAASSSDPVQPSSSSRHQGSSSTPRAAHQSSAADQSAVSSTAKPTASADRPFSQAFNTDMSAQIADVISDRILRGMVQGFKAALTSPEVVAALRQGPAPPVAQALRGRQRGGRAAQNPPRRAANARSPSVELQAVVNPRYRSSSPEEDGEAEVEVINLSNAPWRRRINVGFLSRPLRYSASSQFEI